MRHAELYVSRAILIFFVIVFNAVLQIGIYVAARSVQERFLRYRSRASVQSSGINTAGWSDDVML